MRLLATGAVVVAAAVAAWMLYVRYVERPWTRNGQVRANIVLIAPRVGGVVSHVAVADNQSVAAGELLFEIDPSAYELALRTAQGNLAVARLQVAGLEAGLDVSRAALAEADAAVTAARSRIGSSQALVRAAESQVEAARAGEEAANAQVDAAAAALNGLEVQFARAQRLAERGAGPVATVDALNASVAASRSAAAAMRAGTLGATAARTQAEAALERARADLTTAEIGLVEAEARRQRAAADLRKSEIDLGEPGEANARIVAARAAVATAELNLSWTKVVAPADGVVTNLTVNIGMFASPGAPLLAFVDGSSFRVAGYFRETQLAGIEPGDTAWVTLLSSDGPALRGRVESVGLAINPPRIATIDGPQGLVPQVQPNFDWIRLAQRVPVRIELLEMPADVPLIVGTTVSVAIEPSR